MDQDLPGGKKEAGVRPVDLQQIGSELAIKWEDGTESFIALENLRRACPCAGCMGERDIMGQLHKGPEAALAARSFQLLRLELVGAYAVQPVWADGHRSGIFSFDYLRRLAG
jgi:DUF971 family protein